MSWNLFSLVLAGATSWSLLLLGYLPVATVRRLGSEPIKATGAWAVVAATAPPAIFHWYLIFALICLVGWTKLERPAGKIWLATAAALGLSLGMVFPLETSPVLAGLKSPLALGVLYLGGATTGLAYVLSVLAQIETPAPSLRGWARWLVILALGWMMLLVAARVGPLPLLAGLGTMVLALLAWNARRQGALNPMRWLAAATALAAFATSLLAALAFR